MKLIIINVTMNCVWYSSPFYCIQNINIYTERLAWSLTMIECRCTQADVWLHPLKHHLFTLLLLLSWLYTGVTVSSFELLSCPLIISFLHMLHECCRKFINVSYRHNRQVRYLFELVLLQTYRILDTHLLLYSCASGQTWSNRTKWKIYHRLIGHDL
jgi:hypothetical protein